jgi:hypothetical protein
VSAQQEFGAGKLELLLQDWRNQGFIAAVQELIEQTPQEDPHMPSYQQLLGYILDGDIGSQAT